MEALNIPVKVIFIDNMIFAYFLGMCSFLAVSKFRELFGGGTIFVDTPLAFDLYGNLGNLFGITLQTNGLMVDSVGAFMLLGIIIWIQRTKNGYVEH